MGILDDLKADAEKPKYDRCKVGRFLRSLDDEERDDWTFALSAESGFEHVLIWKHMSDRVPGLGVQAVKNHRNGACRCGD